MTNVLHSKRDQWLARRRALLCASDIPAVLRPVLGYDHHRGPWDVFNAKVGVADEPETEEMIRGREFEAPIANAYERQTGRPVRELGEYELVTHPSIPWLGCTPDRRVWREDDRDGGPLQIKLALGSWDAWRDGPPEPYVVQVRVEIACLGATWGSLTALTGAGPLEVHDFEADDFLELAMPHLERFRWHVLRGIPPPVESPRDLEPVKRLWPRADERRIALDGDEPVAEADRWQRYKRFEARAKERGDEYEARLRARLGDASYGALRDGTGLALKNVNRAGAKPFRVLRRWVPKNRRGWRSA